MNKGERIEDLQCNGLKIIQNKELYCFTSDSVILANFVKVKTGEKALEIGAGCGVISILLTAKTKAKKIVAFEMQDELAELAKRNVELNSLGDKIEIVHDKIQNYRKYFEDEQFDVVFSNPPYMHSDEKNKNEKTPRDLARHDSTLSLQDLCASAKRALRFGGRLYLVYDPSRTAELVHSLIENSLEPKTMFFTENGKKAIKLVVIEAVKGGKHGVKVLPALVTNDPNGDYLDNLKTKNFNAS